MTIYGMLKILQLAWSTIEWPGREVFYLISSYCCALFGMTPCIIIFLLYARAHIQSTRSEEITTKYSKSLFRKLKYKVSALMQNILLNKQNRIRTCTIFSQCLQLVAFWLCHYIGQSMLGIMFRCQLGIYEPKNNQAYLLLVENARWVNFGHEVINEIVQCKW